jgi:SPP1 gp7 family putative phage head morphogenesis protein
MRQPKGLELKYAVQLRQYQRAINKELLEVLAPIVATFRQDATTEEIETAMEESQEVITQAILFGAPLLAIVAGQGNDITRFNDKKYSAAVYEILGFNSLPAETISELVDSWTVENIKLIKGVNDEQIKKIETLLLRSTREQLLPLQITEEIRKIMKSSLSRATLIAKDQTLKLNGQIDRAKQTGAGVERYTWRSSRDERVRSQDRAQDGKIFRWDRPPPGGHPGQKINCRCSAEPFLEDVLGKGFANA